ncbi:LacI family DNA-binding transcriptional regulator [Bifidobacterium sp. 82T10]|uniref:LacI family DNA-binding transcriptional regulator n=1 Tax=Bifidobacterium miconis TaxID=2834435 RepID=A0ABS6WHM7_9BIFI|nr:LacI family DNA-binding transcriptional regulator [Bifidobacterium miconis]MBW3093528.1 LacI family DNA-binding transcriptional regulator [Bifidobacterium miconis]
MGLRVTIKDVAKEAGTSIKTVSNVLNQSGRMRPETRRRVEDAIRRLGYTPNVSARAMRSGGSKLIGLNIAGFSQPFGAYLADSVIAAAKRRQYGVIVNTYSRDKGGLAGSIADTLRLGADGWIFAADRALTDGGSMLDQPYPIVLAGDYLSYGKCDSVTVPNAESLRAVTKRFLDMGYTRVALIGCPPNVSSEQYIRQCREGAQSLRMQGYVRAFEEHGMTIDWRYAIATFGWDRRSGVRAVADMLDRLPLPQVMLCLNDAMALGAIYELQARGLRVPEDVQVVGFDNVPESEYSVPALTTIDPNIRDYAEHAVGMLIERVEGYEGPARSYVTDYTLVERATAEFGHE